MTHLLDVEEPAPGRPSAVPPSAAPPTTPRTEPRTEPRTGRQPWLHDLVVALSAPSQLWVGQDGDAGGVDGPRGAEGFYQGDVRVLSRIGVLLGGAAPVPVRTCSDGAGGVLAVGVARHLGDDAPDPSVRVERRRRVVAGRLVEELLVRSTAVRPVEAALEVHLAADLAPVDDVKQGRVAPPVVPEVDTTGASGAPATGDGEDAVVVTWRRDGVTARLRAPGARLDVVGGAVVLVWDVALGRGEELRVGWSATAEDPSAVVAAPPSRAGWAERVRVDADDSRVARLVARALGDLDALRLVTTAAPGEVFLAAGAPWFSTLFGRDSLWAARMLLPLGTELAASTLRVLASRQGAVDDPATAEEPGKILHELRSAPLEAQDAAPDGGASTFTLPPVYYGTVDATPLWVCLLHEAWRAGMPREEVAALLPSLRAALAWQRRSAAADPGGFLSYVDRSGTGLSNQGWKDSSDAVQWHDGALAQAPIALCEVQGYAHAAAVGGAELLEAFGEPGAEQERAWAAALRTRFRDRFWVGGAGGHPAIALDARGRAVDSLTSNTGHLLGTGLLDPAEEALVARHLASPAMSEGYGLRTLSSDAAGFSPLSYHGGSVWSHDTAIAITGLARAGRGAEAAVLAEGLLAAAEGFDHRLPELHGGESRADAPTPVPYPASCRPQAWSAAAAVALLSALLGTPPGAAHPAEPLRGADGRAALGALRVTGLVVDGRPATATVDAAGAARWEVADGPS